MKFSENLRLALLENKMSQEKLAKKLNTSQATISRWVKGVNQPDFDILLLICEILDRTPNELLGWDD